MREVAAGAHISVHGWRFGFDLLDHVCACFYAAVGIHSEGQEGGIMKEGVKLRLGRWEEREEVAGGRVLGDGFWLWEIEGLVLGSYQRTEERFAVAKGSGDEDT